MLRSCAIRSDPGDKPQQKERTLQCTIPNATPWTIYAEMKGLLRALEHLHLDSFFLGCSPSSVRVENVCQQHAIIFSRHLLLEDKYLW